MSFGLAAIIDLIVFLKRPMKTMVNGLTIDRSSDDVMADSLSSLHMPYHYQNRGGIIPMDNTPPIIFLIKGIAI